MAKKTKESKHTPEYTDRVWQLAAAIASNANADPFLLRPDDVAKKAIQLADAVEAALE